MADYNIPVYPGTMRYNPRVEDHGIIIGCLVFYGLLMTASCTLASKQIFQGNCQDPDRRVGAWRLSPNRVSGKPRGMRRTATPLASTSTLKLDSLVSLACRIRKFLVSRAINLGKWWRSSRTYIPSLMNSLPVCNDYRTKNPCVPMTGFSRCMGSLIMSVKATESIQVDHRQAGRVFYHLCEFTPRYLHPLPPTSSQPQERPCNHFQHS